MKILTIVGARPQFIKSGPFSRAVRKKHHEVLLHTGQHYDNNMSEVFFEEMGLPKPDINLEVGSGSHAEQTAKILVGIENIILKSKFDLVVVYGDTNSTIGGALAASKVGVPIAHIEAGLRSSNRFQPEEINRIATDHLSDILLAPTKTAMRLLKLEGLSKKSYLIGDVMYDAILQHINLSDKVGIIDELRLSKGQYILATIHRAENTDNKIRLKAILSALKDSCKNIVFPLHPRTKKYIEKYNLGKYIDNFFILDPVGYLEMLALEKNAQMIVTDSGGVQKEGYLLGIPVVTLRDETEWVETVESGWNKVVGADYSRILDSIGNFSPRSKRPDYYGKGNAAEKAVEVIEEWMNVRN